MIHLLCLLLCFDEPSTPIASITATSQGQPIEQSDDTDLRTIQIAIGQQIKLSSEKSVHGANLLSLVWNVKPKTIQTEMFPDGSAIILTGPISPATITVQQIVSLGDSIAWQELTIICGTGPRPPPDDVTPVPQPVPGTKKFTVSLVSESKLATPEEAIIRNSVAFWNGLKLRGHDWIFYDSLTLEKQGIDAKAAMAAKQVKPPAIVIMEAGSVQSVIALPPTTKAIDAEVKRLGGQ